MTPEQFPPEKLQAIDCFVESLNDPLRRMMRDYISVEDLQENQPEVIALFWKYGEKLEFASEYIALLQQDVNLPFTTLRTELRRRLYH